MKKCFDQSAWMVSLFSLGIYILLIVFTHVPGKSADSGDDSEAKRPNRCFLSILRDHDTHAPIVRVLLRVREVRELRDGYELLFKGTEDEIGTLVDFVLRERHCCTFLTFGLIFESEKRGIRLQIRGGAGVKDMVKLLLPEGQIIKTYDPGDPR